MRFGDFSECPSCLISCERMFLNSSEHEAQSLNTLVPPTPPQGTGVSIGIVGHATSEAHTVSEKTSSFPLLHGLGESMHPWHQDTTKRSVYFLLEQGL